MPISEYQKGNVNLELQRKSTSTNQFCYFTLQNETPSEPLQNDTKMDKLAQKNWYVCLLAHSVGVV